MSTVEGVQYRGGKNLLLFEYPTVLNTPHSTHDIPHVYHDIPPRYSNFFLALTIRLSTTTLKRFYLAPPNLVTFCFYLLDTFWQNFSKINLPGGLLQLFLK